MIVNHKSLRQSEALRLFGRQLSVGFEPDTISVYRSADGSEYMCRVRMVNPSSGQKFIRPMHRLEDEYVVGEPSPGANGKPLYGLLRLIKTKGPVLVVEGEKCAKALLNRGILATTSGSAQSAKGADWSPIAGRKVTIWPDNDEAGYAYMEDVANILSSYGCSVDAIDIEKLHLKQKADCVDYFSANPKATGEAIRGLAVVSISDAVSTSVEANREFTFPEIRPWPDRVKGGDLLKEIRDVIRRFVIADKETVVAAALWILHTWLLDCFDVSPIAHITAAEKQCGKTILLTLIGMICYRPLQAANFTPAVIFRLVEAHHPTLLIDEVDSFVSGNEQMRGILNSGHLRASAFAVRCTGDDHDPKPFSTWAAKALCGIGALPETLADRSIALNLLRKLPSETVSKIRLEPTATWSGLRARIARFSHDNRRKIKLVKPLVVNGLNDRANDSWEPLLAIAEVAGPINLANARAAALKLNKPADVQSIGSQLIDAIYKIFDEQRADRMHTAMLVKYLLSDDDTVWRHWKRGQPINGHDVANTLKLYKITPQQMRIGSLNRKGYKRVWFEDAYLRYGGARIGDTKKGGVNE